MHYKVIRLSEIKEALGKNISDWREVDIFMMSEKISARDENLQLAVVVDNDDTTYFKSVIEYADLAFSLKDGILTMIKCRG